MGISRRGLVAGVSATIWAQDVQPKRLKLALIGAGHRAWAFIQVLKAIPDFELVALADPAPEFRDRAASLASPGVRTYSDYRDLLAREGEVSAVIVITPTFLHAEPSIAALRSGRHVLCEKPMALSIEQANQMIAAAEQAGKTLQIGLQIMALIGETGNLQSEIGKLTHRTKSGDVKEIEIARSLPHTATATLSGPDQDVGTYRELVAFANSVRTGAAPFCDGKTAKQVLKISLLAEKSIREGRIVTWDDQPA